MKCRFCTKWFSQSHFNQYYCGHLCKLGGGRLVKDRYKRTAKGAESERRWRRNPEKKRIDRKYATSGKGRARAVKYQSDLLKIPYYLERKRMGQRAGYRRLRAELFAKYGMCFACHSEDKLTIDHIIPMSMGGRHEMDNIQVLCLSCNARKGQEIIRYELPQVQQDIN